VNTNRLSPGATIIANPLRAQFGQTSNVIALRTQAAF
jgi:hypothetical protein